MYPGNFSPYLEKRTYQFFTIICWKEKNSGLYNIKSYVCFDAIISSPYVDSQKVEEINLSPESSVVGQGQKVDISNWQCMFC